MSAQVEDRYVVLKRKDLNAALNHDEKNELAMLMLKVELHRARQGKQPLACMVVESDWPMYADTKQLILEFADATAQV